MAIRNFGYRVQLQGGKATEEDLQRARKAFDDFITSVSGKAPQAGKAFDSFGESAERGARRAREALKEPPAGLKALSSGVESARGELNALAARVPVIGPALAAIGPAGLAAAAGIGAVAVAARQALKTADELGDAAEQIGVTAKALQDYRFAAAGSAVDVEKLDAALVKFAANLGAAQDGAQQQQLAFLGLGLSIFDAGGKVRKTEDVFRDFADALAAIDEPQARAAAAAAILGEKVGPKMAALLAQGAKGFDEAGAKLERFGRISDDTIKKADEFDKTISQLTLQVKGFIAESVFQDGPRFLQRDIDDAKALYKLYNDLLVHPLRKALEFATGGRAGVPPRPPSTTPDLTGGLRPPISGASPLNLPADILAGARGEAGAASVKELGEGFAVLAQGLGLVLDKGVLVRKEEVELAKATLAVNAAIAKGGEALAAFGGDADKARAALEAITTKLDPVKAAVKALKDEAALLRVPEGFERDLAKAAQTLKEKLGRPLTDDDVKPLATAQFDTATAKTEDLTRQTNAQADAAARAAKANQLSAASQREADRVNRLAAEGLRLGLSPAQAQYIRDTGQIPFVNAKLTKSLTEFDAGLRRVNKAAADTDFSKFDAQSKIAIQSAENLADAAGLGEAAARKAAAANAVLAAGDHGAAEAAKQAALEQAKVREIRNEIVRGMEQEIEANDRMAAAAAKGAAAAITQADAEVKIAAERRLGAGATKELEEIEAKLLDRRISAANRQVGEAAGKARDEATDQKRLAEAIEGGRAALARYQDEQAAVEILRSKGIASLDALNRMTGEEADKLKASTAALISNNRERREAAAIAGVKQRVVDARDELEILRAENALIGANRIERAVLIQGLRDEIQMRRALETLGDSPALRQEWERLKAVNAELAKQREIAKAAEENARAFTEPWVRAIDNLQDFIGEMAQGAEFNLKKLAAVGKRLASELIAAFLRINVLNPLGAAIGIPGIVNTGGALFGGGAQAATAPAQSLAGGALNAAGNVNSAIGFFDRVGNFIKDPSKTFDAIGNFVSNPFGVFGGGASTALNIAPSSPLFAGGSFAAGAEGAASLGLFTEGAFAAGAEGAASLATIGGAAAEGSLLSSLGPALAGLAEAAPYIAAAVVAVTLLMSIFKKTPHPSASAGFLIGGGPGAYTFDEADPQSKHIGTEGVVQVRDKVLQPYLESVGKQYGITYGSGQVFSAFGDKTSRIGHDFFATDAIKGQFPVEGGPPGLERRIFEFDPEKQDEVSTALARLTLSLIQTAPAVEDVNVKTAAMNISLDASGEEINKALSFASKFTETMKLVSSGFDPVQSQMAQIGKTAEEFGDRLKTTVTEFRDQAVELKLATPEEANAALQQLLKAQLGLIETAPPLEGLALQLAQTKANFEALKPALLEAGFTAEQAGELIAQGFAKFKTGLGDDFLEQLGRQANEAMGRGFLNSLDDIGTQADALFADALRLFDPSDPRLAQAVQGINDVFGGLVNQAIAGLDAAQLQQVIDAYADVDTAQGQFIRQMAQNTLAWRNVTEAVEETTIALSDAGQRLIEDLGIRELRLAVAPGSGPGAEREILAKQGALDKQRQLDAALAEGFNPEQLARLAAVIDGELNQALTEFDAKVAESAAAIAKASADFDSALNIRELRATGKTRDAAIAELQAQQAAEREAAIAAGRTAEQLQRLEAVLSLEMTAAIAELDRQATGATGAVQDLAAAAAAFNADVQVRILRASGRSLEADLLAIDQRHADEVARATEIGADLVALETAYQLERQAIIDDYNRRALEEQERAAAEQQRIAEQAARERERAEEEARRRAEQAAEEAARAEEERQRRLVAAADFRSDLIARVLEAQGREAEAQYVRLAAEAQGLRRQAQELGVDGGLVDAYVKARLDQLAGELGGSLPIAGADPIAIGQFNSNLTAPASRSLINLSRVTGDPIRRAGYDGAVDLSGFNFDDLAGGGGASIDVDLSPLNDPTTNAIRALHADEKTLLTDIRDELKAIRGALAASGAAATPATPSGSGRRHIPWDQLPRSLRRFSSRDLVGTLT